MIYKMYVPPIFKFRCVLYSGAPAYKLHPLVLLEREALRPCFGFPKFIANNVLYLETHVTSLMCRFRLLMVQTFLKMYELAIKLQIIFISQSIIFFFQILALVPHSSGRLHTDTCWFFRCMIMWEPSYWQWERESPDYFRRYISRQCKTPLLQYIKWAITK